MLNNNLPKYLNISSDASLVRDTYSMGVLNTNQSAYEAYLKQHQIALAKIAEDRRKDAELNSLRSELTEVKQLLLKLLEKKNADCSC